MEDITNPTSAPAGQPETGLQQNAGQPEPVKPQSDASTTQIDPRIAELEQKTRQYEERLAHSEQFIRQERQRADQAQARLQALAGVTPQADPLAKDVEYFVKNGINADDARLFAGFVNQKVGAVQQQYQQQTQALQATSTIGDVLNMAVQQDPSLFSDQVYAEVQQQLRQEALQGANYITPEYALDHAAIIQSRIARASRANPNAPQPMSPKSPAFNSFMGAASGLRPAPAIQAAPNPIKNHFDAEIKAHLNPSKPTY